MKGDADYGRRELFLALLAFDFDFGDRRGDRYRCDSDGLVDVVIVILLTHTPSLSLTSYRR